MATTYHILCGDCLADQLRLTTIDQNFIVCRECLIDGDLAPEHFADFWKIRANFVADTYQVSTEEYYNKVVNELEKLRALPNNSEVCLWFENDLFCQANMWFVIALLTDKPTIKLHRIFPTISNIADKWKGFGISNAAMLAQSYAAKVSFNLSDIELGNNLWAAYKNGDFEKLKELSTIQSDCFQCLVEVCQAHIDRFPTGNTLGRPDQIVKEIIETKSTHFQDVFLEFSNREGVYGFGDLQLKSIYDRQMYHRQ